MHGPPGFSQLSNASPFDKSSSAFSQSLVTVSLPARSTVSLLWWEPPANPSNFELCVPFRTRHDLVPSSASHPLRPTTY